MMKQTSERPDQGCFFCFLQVFGKCNDFVMVPYVYWVMSILSYRLLIKSDKE